MVLSHVLCSLDCHLTCMFVCKESKIRCLLSFIENIFFTIRCTFLYSSCIQCIKHFWTFHVCLMIFCLNFTQVYTSGKDLMALERRVVISIMIIKRRIRCVSRIQIISWRRGNKAICRLDWHDKRRGLWFLLQHHLLVMIHMMMLLLVRIICNLVTLFCTEKTTNCTDIEGLVSTTTKYNASQHSQDTKQASP